ncbi:hypothetical protein RF11_08558 [Thelohanellus kitauei]|uniref:Uncharacterized protein n=1 Tax=Thelohanellus kitauei TaxID=669202 RepID=A0A0C2MJ46_THEKT|nr:hypothetical protein RF11_08558 [Thelohanellus kitauei]
MVHFEDKTPYYPIINDSIISTDTNHVLSFTYDFLAEAECLKHDRVLSSSNHPPAAEFCLSFFGRFGYFAFPAPLLGVVNALREIGPAAIERANLSNPYIAALLGYLRPLRAHWHTPDRRLIRPRDAHGLDSVSNMPTSEEPPPAIPTEASFSGWRCSICPRTTALSKAPANRAQENIEPEGNFNSPTHDENPTGLNFKGMAYIGHPKSPLSQPAGSTVRGAHQASQANETPAVQ